MRTLPDTALRHDPVPTLLACGDPALAWAVGHDLLREPLDPAVLWALPYVVRTSHAQNPDGSWSYPGIASRRRAHEDYAQLETYKTLLVLVSKYRLDRRHPAVERAAEFLLGRQTLAGDLRGIYGAQYTPNYTADILRLLIEAGYAHDKRVRRGIAWLLSMRQHDGGWAVPTRTAGSVPLGKAINKRVPLEPDRSRPSSHLITGIVLRALAADPAHRHTEAAVLAARLLASRFFKPDVYPDHKDARYWTKLHFPFRWTDLVSALDAISLIGLAPADPHVDSGLAWLRAHQHGDGLWEAGYPKDPDPYRNHWVSLAAARIFNRFFDSL